MIIIGLAAKARQGKDTAAEAIQQYYAQSSATAKKHGLVHPGPKVVIMKFATALYQEVNEAIKNDIWETRTVRETRPLNTTGKTIVGKNYIMPTNATCEVITCLPADVQPDPNPEVTALAPYGKHSRLLVWWGTEYRRAQDPDYWVKKALAAIPQTADIVIFTDLRFHNEAKALKALGGHLVEVVRLSEDGTRYYAIDRSKDHISETALDGFNFDFNITSKSAALTAEMAITIAEFIRSLESR